MEESFVAGDGKMKRQGDEQTGEQTWKQGSLAGGCEKIRRCGSWNLGWPHQLLYIETVLRFYIQYIDFKKVKKKSKKDKK